MIPTGCLSLSVFVRYAPRVDAIAFLRRREDGSKWTNASNGLPPALQHFGRLKG